MELLPEDLMPMDDDATYVKHVSLIVLGWTALVILAGVMLALLTL